MANSISFEPMNLDHLRVMDEWKYNAYFPDFDLSAYHASHEKGLTPLPGPAGCEGFAVKDGEALIGLFEYYRDVDGQPEIGMALNPRFIYQGLGKQVMRAGIDFLLHQRDYRERFIYLTVAIKNVPAVRFYQKFGFSTYRDVVDQDGVITDLKMKYELRGA
ncbi:MAG: GNAT family N-acetyltransferase [Flavobacteriales bacterium]|nr:GNAT family N-acetyltransferase [Flavobacteriales bacterium]